MTTEPRREANGDMDGAGRAWRFPLFASLLLLVVAIALQAPVIGGGFFGDDPRHLMTARRPDPLGRAFGPGRGVEVDQFFFTPLLGLSFAVDWRLFGLDPRGYNVHNVVSLWLAGLAALFLLRTMAVGRGVSLLGAVAFMAAPATLSVTSYLSTRHYLEGAVWAFLALAFGLKWRESNGGRWLAGAVACTLMAALCKEIFVPLPAVALLLGLPAQRRRRFLFGVAMSLTLVAYFGLRAWNHGSLIGGYAAGQYSLTGAAGALLECAPLAAAMVVLPPRIVGQLGATGVAVVAAIGVGSLFCACWRRRGARSTAILLGVLGIALAPVALVLEHGGCAALIADAAGYRLLFPFASATLLAAVWVVGDGCNRASGRRFGTVVAASAIALAVIPGGLTVAREWRELRVGSGAALGFLWDHWSRSEQVVLWDESWRGFRVGTELLFEALAPGPHLRLLGEHPVRPSEVAAVDPESFFVLPDDLVQRLTRSSAQNVARVGTVAQLLREPEETSTRFSMRFVWDGASLSWELEPAGPSYFLRNPMGTAEDTIAGYFGVLPVGSVPAVFFAERGLRVVALQVRLVTRERAFRDSPTIELDLSQRSEVLWGPELP